MAGREITVNTSTLAGDIDELQTALSNAEAQLHDMFNQIAELDAMWDGPANEAFNRQFQNDYENAKRFCATVAALIGCMEYARNQYNSCEGEVNGIVAAIRT